MSAVEKGPESAVERLFFTPEDVERALNKLGPTASYAEGLVKTAALAAVHVMRGGTLVIASTAANRELLEAHRAGDHFDPHEPDALRDPDCAECLGEPESADPITQAKAAADRENREGDPAFNGALNRW